MQQLAVGRTCEYTLLAIFCLTGSSYDPFIRSMKEKSKSSMCMSGTNLPLKYSLKALEANGVGYNC